MNERCAEVDKIVVRNISLNRGIVGKHTGKRH
jgi:hypothetical protein